MVIRHTTRPARLKSSINPKLERKLVSYATAAGAAGIGILALSQPAEARVIYTKADIVLNHFGTTQVALDLNGDGVTDISFGLEQAGVFSYLFASAPTGNKWVYGTSFGLGQQPKPMRFGLPVGPGEPFLGGQGFMVRSGCVHTSACYLSGLWVNQTNRYVGLEFLISGQIHYGWVRISVNDTSLPTATITGYAYETGPRSGIITGDLREPSSSGAEGAAVNDEKIPATLGALARGAVSLEAWRGK